jgi:hypothetical protein
LWNGWHGVLEACTAKTMRAKEPQESPQCRRHRLNVGAREPLRLCDDDLAEELGVPASRPIAKRREQPHDHAAVQIDRPLADAAVLAKPVLVLDHTPIEHRDRARRFLPHDPALAEELDDPAHAPHVLAGEVLLTTLIEATAAMPREPSDDCLVNVGDR